MSLLPKKLLTARCSTFQALLLQRIEVGVRVLGYILTMLEMFILFLLFIMCPIAVFIIFCIVVLHILINRLFL